MPTLIRVLACLFLCASLSDVCQARVFGTTRPRGAPSRASQELQARIHHEAWQKLQRKHIDQLHRDAMQRQREQWLWMRDFFQSH